MSCSHRCDKRMHENTNAEFYMPNSWPVSNALYMAILLIIWLVRFRILPESAQRKSFWIHAVRTTASRWLLKSVSFMFTFKPSRSKLHGTIGWERLSIFAYVDHFCCWYPPCLVTPRNGLRKSRRMTPSRSNQTVSAWIFYFLFQFCCRAVW